MRSLSEYLNWCLSLVNPIDPLRVLLPDAVGCILAEDIKSPINVPNVDQATRDGYAVRSTDIIGASLRDPQVLSVIAEVKAGDSDPCSLATRSAVKVASGAPIPAGADAVIPIEDTENTDSKVRISSTVKSGTNIIKLGEDIGENTPILRAGTRIGARQIALLAGVGILRVKVRPRPRVVVLSIGNELIEPGNPIGHGRVYDANGHTLSSAIADSQADVFRVAAVPDEPQQLSNTLEDQLVRADIVITTGGLSYGAGDTVKEVLSPLGTVRFDAVAISPGKLIGAGKIGEGIPIFCLPGRPVAAQIAYEIFVRPCLRHLAGWEDLYRPSVRAKVSQSWVSPAGKRQFVPVKLMGNPSTGYRAKPTGVPDDLLLSSMSKANALAVIPESITEVKEGDIFHCMILD